MCGGGGEKHVKIFKFNVTNCVIKLHQTAHSAQLPCPLSQKKTDQL